MEDSTNREDSSVRRAQDDAELAEASKFIEDLQKASEEIEADIQRKKPISHPEPDYNMLSTPLQRQVAVEKEGHGSPERGFDQDLSIQAEEVTKEIKRLEEIQKNLEKNQKIVAECIQELTVLQGEISKAWEGKKKIEEGLRKMREKSQKIFVDLKETNSFRFPKQ
jgi:uncharacterized protein YbaP (TraB family)